MKHPNGYRNVLRAGISSKSLIQILVELLFVFTLALILGSLTFHSFPRPLFWIQAVVALGLFIWIRPKIAWDFLALGISTWIFIFTKIQPKWEIFGDNTYYIQMIRQGIFSVTTQPFAMRWLTPLLAGSLNSTPTHDLAALNTLNFAALVASFYYLAKGISALRVHRFWIYLIPFFINHSQFGQYASENRFLTDPMNYLFFALFFYSLTSNIHQLLPLFFALSVLNSEKAIFWLPVFGLAFVQSYGLKTGLRKWLHVSLPGLVIFISTRFLFAHTPPVNTLHPENFIDLFSNPFHIGWYPFSILTLVFFAEFKFLPSVLKAISILILPIYFQLLIAGDLERMTAYAFIVLIPSTILWLNRMTTHYFLKFKILISALFLVLYFQFTRHTQIVFGLSVFFILANTLISANIAKKTVKNGVTQ